MGSSSTRDEFNPRFLYIYHGLYGQINSMPAWHCQGLSYSIEHLLFVPGTHQLITWHSVPTPCCAQGGRQETRTGRGEEGSSCLGIYFRTPPSSILISRLLKREREKRDYDKEESSLPVFMESSFVVQEEGRFYVESSASSSLPHNPVPYVQPPSQPYLSIYPFVQVHHQEREAQHNHHQVLLRRNNFNRPPPPPRY